MNIKWYGHAAFKITTADGIVIIIDPYESGYAGGALSYGNIADEADIVITSHAHGDHNYIKSIKGKYDHIKDAGCYEVRKVMVKMIPSFHDDKEGKEKGKNLISVIAADGLTVSHMGDIGHTLDAETLKQMGMVDILLLPVGGLYTTDAAAATSIMQDIKAAITIPMHYRTSKCSFPIATLDAFISGKGNVSNAKKAELSVTKEGLPQHSSIVVLEHALQRQRGIN